MAQNSLNTIIKIVDIMFWTVIKVIFVLCRDEENHADARERIIDYKWIRVKLEIFVL